jgi:ABC-type transporter Mla subunit MlaD
MRRPDKLSSFAVGAIVLVALAVGSWAVFSRFNPFADPFEVRAAFTGPTQAQIGTPVRLAGVNVGKVTAIEEGPQEGTSVVVMEIEAEGLPLHGDATFKIRPRLFLEGNYFIEASPGTPQADELEEGSVVPATQTAGPVSVGDLLKTFDTNTREDVRSVLSEYGRALEGGGAAAFNRTTRYWERAYGNSAKVNDAALGERDGDLAGYVRNSGRVAAALSRNETQLRELVTNLAQTGDAFARQQLALSAAVAELPRTLNQGFRTLGVVDRALPPVRTLARELTPAIRTSPATLDASIPLARELRGIIGQKELGGVARSLSVAAPALARFAHGGIRLQGQQRLLASCLNNVSLPTSEATVPDPVFPAPSPVYQEFVKWLPGLAGGARSFDANGVYSRSIASTANFTYPVGRRVWFNTQPLRGINPAPADLPPFRPTVPCETQQPPDLGSNPQPPPPGIKTQPDAPGEVAAVQAAIRRARGPLRQLAREGGLSTREPPRLLRPNELDEAVRNAGGGR